MMYTKTGAVGKTRKKISEDHYQNKGFIIKGNDTIITEQVALRKTADGIFYTSTMEGQNNKKPVSFKLSSSYNNIFIFENSEHDFPKGSCMSSLTAKHCMPILMKAQQEQNAGICIIKK